MYRKLALLFCVSAASIAVSAQQLVQGKVLDKDNEGVIEQAAVRLLKRADSTLVMGVQTDGRGSFSLNKVKDGSYLVEVRYLGYDKSFTPVTVAGKNVIMKIIYLKSKPNELGPVEVRGRAAQMVVKRDTIEFNPAAFKLADNAVVEDLLKKLPGVTVDNDGKITVNGEEIKRIRVDGKKFFDGDMQMTTKNMPANMVDKVQVLDLKSEQAQMTGFEDENTERIINLTIKADRRKGVFGNITAGGGADKDNVGRYDGNAFVNIWRGDVRTTVTGGANNTNAMRSGRGMSGMGGGGMGGGYTETQNLGVNVNAELGKKTVVGGDASYNHSNTESTTDSERENWTKYGNYLTVGNNKSNRSNQSANLGGEVEWTPDTISTLRIQPEIGANWSDSKTHNNSTYTTIINKDSTLTSDNISDNNSTSTSNDASMRVLYNRKSPVKKGRSVTVNLNGSLSTSNTDGNNYNKKTMYTLKDVNGKDSVNIVDQYKNNNSNSYQASVSVSYVEPIINLNNYVELYTELRADGSKSDQMQYNSDGQYYTILDSVYSNRFHEQNFNETFRLTFQHRENNFNYRIGVSALPYQKSNTTDYFVGNDLVRNQSRINFSPTATFEYNLMPVMSAGSGITGARNRSRIRIDYRGNMQQPSVNQLQPVKNNDNLMRESVGNPDLIPAFSQNFQLSYSHNNSERLSNIQVGLSGSFTQNALVSNSIIDQTGKTWSQTVNANDIPFNTSANFSYSTPIIKNRLQFATNTSGNFRQSFSYSDNSRSAQPFVDAEQTVLRMGELGTTNNWGGNENINLTFSTDWLEIGARGQMSYNASKNTLNNNKLTETFTWSGTGNIDLTLPYNLVISNDLGYTARSGYSSYTKNELNWNATIQKSVFNSLGTVSLALYDILHQRQNISENISDNSRSLSRSNTLTSYFMLSFTYRISQFGGAGGGFGGGMGGFGGGMGGMGGGMGGMGGGMGGMGGGRF